MTFSFFHRNPLSIYFHSHISGRSDAGNSCHSFHSEHYIGTQNEFSMFHRRDFEDRRLGFVRLLFSICSHRSVFGFDCSKVRADMVRIYIVYLSIHFFLRSVVSLFCWLARVEAEHVTINTCRMPTYAYGTIVHAAEIGYAMTIWKRALVRLSDNNGRNRNLFCCLFDFVFCFFSNGNGKHTSHRPHDKQ